MRRADVILADLASAAAEQAQIDDDLPAIAAALADAQGGLDVLTTRRGEATTRQTQFRNELLAGFEAAVMAAPPGASFEDIGAAMDAAGEDPPPPPPEDPTPEEPPPEEPPPEEPPPEEP
jgi:hypothetical protein